MVFTILFLLTLIPFHIGLWKLFVKAGRKGWESVIPIYDLYVIQKITGKPVYWIFAALFPGIGFIVLAAMLINLYKSFGKFSTKEHFLGVFFYFYFVPKWAADPKTVYTSPDKLPVRKKSQLRDWGEAAVFAIVAATIIKSYTFEAYKIPSSSMEETLLVGDFLFVSKLNYGPKIPSLPLTFPFTHNSFRDIPIPGMPATKSYLDWVEFPYLRIPGWQKIKNDDIVVFNFPEGDTIIVDNVLESHSYYGEVIKEAIKIRNSYGPHAANKTADEYMRLGRESLLKQYKIDYRPADKRSNYIKRCVGIPGDVLEVKSGQLFVNDKAQQDFEHKQYRYYIFIHGEFSTAKLKKLGLTKEDLAIDEYGNPQTDPRLRYYPLTAAQVEAIKKMPNVDSLRREEYPKQFKPINEIFPHSRNYDWSLDNFGPLKVPSKGETVQLDTMNIALYKRIISTYEGHKLEIKADKIFIDGAETKTYTFAMNYYFMMGDNRHGSADSRYWGFVPDDHIVGKASMIWMSSGEEGIRWNRIFNFIH